MVLGGFLPLLEKIKHHLAAQSMKELKEKVNIIEEDVKMLIAKSTTSKEFTEFFSVMAYCSMNGIKVTLKETAILGKTCTKLSKEMGITIGTVPDSKYGKVNIYYIDVLKAVFDSKL